MKLPRWVKLRYRSINVIRNEKNLSKAIQSDCSGQNLAAGAYWVCVGQRCCHLPDSAQKNRGDQIDSLND